jgi:ABC-type proline/glycine betaine transport system permease subunit
MPVELLAILVAVLIALAVGLWRTRHERAAARSERRR